MQDDEYAELFKKLPPKSSGSSWQDVATEFENLGKTFADVIRSAWKQSEGDATLTQLRDGLETVIDGIRHTSEGTPETAQARDQLVRVVESIREAVTQAERGRSARTGQSVAAGQRGAAQAGSHGRPRRADAGG